MLYNAFARTQSIDRKSLLHGKKDKCFTDRIICAFNYTPFFNNIKKFF